MIDEKQYTIEADAKLDAMGIGLAMLEVSRKLSAMKSEQLGAMLHEAYCLMRCEERSKQAMGSLLRMQVLEALAERAHDLR